MRERVCAIAALTGKYAELSDEEVAAISRRVRGGRCIECYALDELDPDHVRAVLRNSGLADDQLVSIVWASDRFGISLRFDLFVAWFDDLWFPSSDDVIIAVDGRLRLLLDHEEQLSVMDSDEPS
ncbi:MAG: hypothetical protein AB7P03_16795 [Kofleriaceae bacterium]